MSTNERNRAELKREYREKPPPAGVYGVRCSANGKLALGSALNVQGALNRIQFELKMRMHRTFPALQSDFDQHGEACFAYEILDLLPPSKDPGADPKEELKVLEELWLERLQPFEPRGYNLR